MPLTLQIGAQTKTLTAWGVRSASLRYASLADDTLALTFHPSSALTLPSWSYGDPVKVYDAGGTCRFAGTVLAPGVGRSMRQDRLSLQAAGPWHQLAAVDYTQDGVAWTPGYYDTAVPPVWHEPVLTTYPASRVCLFWQAVTAGSLERGSLTPQQVLVSALAQAGGCCTYGSCSITAPVPVEEAYDLKLADVIRRCCRFAPDAVGWFDYTTTPPTFHLGTRRSIGAVAFSATDSRLAEIALDPRPDLQVQGVIFRYASSEPQATPGASWLKTVDLGTDYAGDPFTDPTRVVSHTFTLAAAADERLPMPTGLAAEYYLATSALHFQGSIELHEVAPTFAFSPGQRLNITGADAALATASALVQESEYDLVTGTTRCTLGPPAHLQPTDIESLTRSLRGVTASTYALTQGTATAQESPESAAAQAAAAAEAAATAQATAQAAAEAAAAAQAAAGNGTAPADTLTQRLQDKLGAFVIQAGSGFQMATMDVTATVHGWVEFGTPSVPPAAYCAATPSGLYYRHYSSPPTPFTLSDFSGTLHVSKETGLIVNPRPTYFLNGSLYGNWGPPPASPTNDPRGVGALRPGYCENFFSPYADQRSVSVVGPDQLLIEGTGVVHSGISYTGSFSVTLSDKDTDADALARAQAAASWSAWTAFVSALNGAAAWQTVRTEGWSSTAHLAKIKATTLRSNIWGYPGRVSIPIYRYPIGGAQPSTPTSTQTFDIYFADTLENIAAEGEAAVWQHVGVASMPEWGLPCEPGYINLAGQPTVSLL